METQSFCDCVLSTFQKHCFSFAQICDGTHYADMQSAPCCWWNCPTLSLLLGRSGCETFGVSAQNFFSKLVFLCFCRKFVSSSFEPNIMLPNILHFHLVNWWHKRCVKALMQREHPWVQTQKSGLPAGSVRIFKKKQVVIWRFHVFIFTTKSQPYSATFIRIWLFYNVFFFVQWQQNTQTLRSSCPGDFFFSLLRTLQSKHGGLVWECRTDFLDASKKTPGFLVIQ